MRSFHIAWAEVLHCFQLHEQGGGRFLDVEGWNPRPEDRENFRAAVLASYRPSERDRAEVWPVLVISYVGILAQRRYLGPSRALLYEHLGEFDQRQRQDIARVVTSNPEEALALLSMASTEACWIINQSGDFLAVMSALTFAPIGDRTSTRGASRRTRKQLRE